MRLLGLLLVIVLSAGAAEERFNVLFLAIDDLNTWALEDANRYTGTVIAPAIQSVADGGLTFSRAYCTAPKCAPSRTSILSGVAPWRSGLYQNAQLVPESPAIQQATHLFKYFQEHGYYTASFGKIAHAYAIADGLDDFVPHVRDPRPPKPNKGWGAIHIPESEMGDTKYADAAIAALQQDHDRPFFIACGMFHPHGPMYAPQKYFDLYPIDETVLPPILETDRADLPPLGLALTDFAALSSEQQAEKLARSQQAIHAYLACTTYADYHIGRVLAALEASPHKDNTIVVLWTDHGYHMGEKQTWGKGTLWEASTHSLLFMKVPGMTEAGQRCERVVSLLDMYPTLVELCGLPQSAHLDGQSLVPLLQQPDQAWDYPAVTGYMGRWEYDVYLTARTEDYRLIRYADGQEEFYDHRQDPNEWTNLIDHPEYRAEIERHRGLLPAPAEPVRYDPDLMQKNR